MRCPAEALFYPLDSVKIQKKANAYQSLKRGEGVSVTTEAEFQALARVAR
jgi:hypothetical protein